MKDVRKNRLISGLTLLLLVGFLLVIFISFFVSRHSLREQIVESSLPLTSDNIYSEIQRDLLQPVFTSSLMASDTFVRDWILQGESDSKDIARYLKEIMNKYGMFTTFLVSDKTLLYYHSDGVLKQVKPDEDRDDWYFRVRNMTEPYEINVDVDMANDDALTVFVNYRMYDYAGGFIGATGVGLTVNAVKKLIESYEERFNRRVYFVNKAGVIMLAGDSFPHEIKNIHDIHGIGDEYDEKLKQTGMVFSYDNDGSTTHLVTRFIPEFDWYLIVEEEEKDVLRQVVQTLCINLIICGVVIGIILYLANIVITSYQNRIQKLAITDKLTGVFNRRAFDLFMGQIMKEGRREKEGLSLVLFDIDHFKLVNDQYGHLAGDQTIVEIIKVVKASIRESDIICRWGGEEFLLILRGCDQENGLRMAENIRRKIENHTTLYNDRKIKVTVSFGVAEFQEGEETDTLINRADKALYKAKGGGRNRVDCA